MDKNGSCGIFVKEVDKKTDELQTQKEQKNRSSRCLSLFFFLKQVDKILKWVDMKLRCTNVSLEEGTIISSSSDLVIEDFLFPTGVLGR